MVPPGSKACTMRLAVYRTALTAEAIKARVANVAPKPVITKVPVIRANELPPGLVRVEVLEHDVSETETPASEWTSNDSEAAKKSAGLDPSWFNIPSTKTDSWTEQAFALAGIIPKYSPRGVRRDRSIPFLIRLAGNVTLPAGEHRILMRAIRGGRLSLDGKVIATSDFFPKPAGPTRASDAEAVPDQLAIQLVKDVALLPPGHSEAMARVTGDGKPHVIVFETFVGGKSLRPELGQPSLSISTNGAPFRVLTIHGPEVAAPSPTRVGRDIRGLNEPTSTNSPRNAAPMLTNSPTGKAATTSPVLKPRSNCRSRSPISHLPSPSSKTLSTASMAGAKLVSSQRSSLLLR